MSRKRRKKDKKSAKRPSREPLGLREEREKAFATPPTIKPKRHFRPGLVLGVIISILALVLIAFFWRHSLLTPAKRDSQLNVLLITLDTTRADHLGCYGYRQAETPNIDWLASQGVRFAQAYAQVPLTFPSHCSIMTGTYPLYHGARNNGTYHLHPDILTLAEAIKSHGFQTAAFVSSFTVDSRFGLDQGFDLYDDNFKPGQAFKAVNAERRAEEVFQPFSAWLEKRDNRPFFCWLHFFDPHLPYDPPSPFKEKFLANPYDGEIAYMDFYVGQVIAKLREKDLLDRILIILAGDHGEGLGEKGEEGHGVFLYEESLQVPLILYAGERLPARKVVKGRVRLIDIMPTILDMLKMPLPAKIQGQSLLTSLGQRSLKDRPNYIETYFPRENYGWSELTGVMDGRWKYIQAPREELYDLHNDPEEKNNWAQQKTEVVAKLKEKLTAYFQAYSSSFAQKKPLTEEEREKLRSLGYVALTEETASGNLPDPKDRLDELKLITAAEIMEFQQKFEAAAELYERILALRPEAPTNYVNLALVYARLNRFDQAVDILEKGVARIPHSLVLLSRLGHTYLVMGRLKKAFDTWQQVLNLDPEYLDGLLSSGWILDLMGEKEGARKFYEKALAIEPENKFLRKNLAFNLATTGNLEEAIKIYEKLAADFPEDEEIWQNLGIAYGYAANIDKAVECLERAISLKPTPTAYLNLAVAKKKKGDLAAAIKYLKLYLENAEGESKEKVYSARAELAELEKSLRH